MKGRRLPVVRTRCYSLIPNLRISLNLNGSYREMFGFAYGVSPFSYAYNTARTIPLRNEDGTLYYHEKWGRFQYGYFWEELVRV